MKHIRYLSEAAIAYLLFYIFKAMPAPWASNIGGFLGRNIGPFMASSRKADKHLQSTFPNKTEGERKAIIKELWDNMGRVIAEYPHLKAIARNHTEIAGEEHLKAILNQEKGGVFIGAHQGNWEINVPALFLKYGTKTDLTYRAPNNPYIDRLLSRARDMKGVLEAHPKSRESGRKIMNTLKNKGYLGILIDQKYNEGLDIPFFGRSAMTNPIAFQLAQKYGVPLVMVRNERLQGCHFRLSVSEPLTLFSEDDTPRPLEEIMQEAHIMLENWITERPEQWIWLHKRWKSE